IMIDSSITVLGVALQGASYNYTFFLCVRIILGFGFGFGFGISTISFPSLIDELSDPFYRSANTAIYNTLWDLGKLIAAWVTYGTRNISTFYCWNIPSYLQALLPLVQVLLF
ncbi:hypothetical protein DFJ63DRAFT_288246, partial [Scheffersomyces coipomensis]|uniref:uncharacterized protein n=1 Tax=Scheffersomyces coipomensis TaxID=1788519 RepID=UPI00315D101A